MKKNGSQSGFPDNKTAQSKKIQKTGKHMSWMTAHHVWGVPCRSRLTSGVMWGGIAGAVVGIGASLALDLFYSADIGMICLTSGVFCVVGALFGHTVEGVMYDKEKDGLDNGHVSGHFYTHKATILSMAEYGGKISINKPVSTISADGNSGYGTAARQISAGQER